MARNDQVTRQWLLLQKLESTRGATLEELACYLPEDLGRHLRTIRRDLEALEVRFPLIVERVSGQTRSPGLSANGPPSPRSRGRGHDDVISGIFGMTERGEG